MTARRRPSVGQQRLQMVGDGRSSVARSFERQFSREDRLNKLYAYHCEPSGKAKPTKEELTDAVEKSEMKLAHFKKELYLGQIMAALKAPSSDEALETVFQDLCESLESLGTACGDHQSEKYRKDVDELRTAQQSLQVQLQDALSKNGELATKLGESEKNRENSDTKLKTMSSESNTNAQKLRNATTLHEQDVARISGLEKELETTSTTIAADNLSSTDLNDKMHESQKQAKHVVRTWKERDTALEDAGKLETELKKVSHQPKRWLLGQATPESRISGMISESRNCCLAPQRVAGQRR